MYIYLYKHTRYSNLFDCWSPFIGCIDKVGAIRYQTRKYQGVPFLWYTVATATDIPSGMMQFVANVGHSQFVNDL